MHLKLVLQAFCLLLGISVGQAYTNITSDPQGLGPWYDGVDAVLDSVIGKEAFPPALISIDDHTIHIAGDFMEILPEILQHYVALLVIVIVGVLLAVLMPIIGFCFCCCRCCGNCGGGKSRPYQKEKESCCGPFIMVTFLFIISAALVLGTIVSFVSNNRLDDGIKGITKTTRVIVNDSTLFLQNTTDDLQSLLITQFDDLSDEVLNQIRESPEAISAELEKLSEKIPLKKLTDVVDELPNIKHDLEKMDGSLTKLNTDINELATKLDDVRQKLETPLTVCGENCKDIKDKTKDLVIGIDVSQLDNPKKVLSDLDNVDKLQADIKKGVDSFQNINKTFSDAIDDNIGDVEKSLNDAGNEIKGQSESLMNSLDILKETVINVTSDALTTADKYIAEYSGYRYYVALGFCLVLLIVVVCVVSGLFCGIFGKMKHNRNDCGTKDVGGAFLITAVVIIFLFATFFAIAVLGQFVVGLLVHRVVCVPFQNPGDDQIFNLINELVNINSLLGANSSDKEMNLSSVITNCHQDKPAYEVFQLENILGKDIGDIESYLDDFDIKGKLRELLNNFEIPSDAEFMNDGIKNDLEKLTTSKLNTFEFKKYTKELSKKLTKTNLDEFAEKLEEVAELNPPAVAAPLKEQAKNLKEYQEDYVKPMIDETNSLKDLAGKLEESIKFKKNSFGEAMEELITELEDAQNFLDNEAENFIHDTVSKFGDNITETIQNYLSFVIGDIKNNTGKCGPLSNAYNATLVTVCNHVLDPFNGFWSGLGWCILLFIPCIIFCVKLATYYRKYDPGFDVLPGIRANKKKQKRQRDHNPSNDDLLNTSQMQQQSSNPYHAAYDNRAYIGETSPKNIDPLQNRWVAYSGPNNQQQPPNLNQIENRWVPYAGKSSDPLENRFVQYSGNTGQPPHLRNPGQNLDNRWTQYEGSHHM